MTRARARLRTPRAAPHAEQELEILGRDSSALLARDSYRCVVKLGRVLLLALSFGLPTTMPRAAHALVWPDVPERVEKALKSADVTTRRAAARELSTLGKARAEALILRTLEDPDLDVRLVAAQAAVTLRLGAATEAVLPWLNDREPKARLAACELAKVSPSPRAIPQLSRTLGDADAAVRAAAADALGSHGSADAVAPLLGKLDDPSPPVRVQVTRALARLGDSRAVVPLVGKVQDSVPEVRQAVVRSLGLLGDPRAIQALVIALRDVNQDVRIEALGALGALHGDGAVDAMASLLTDRTTTVRQAAFAALGKMASKASVSALLPHLGVGEDAVMTLDRTPVRDALVATGSQAEGFLVPLLERAPSQAAATSAAVVLGSLKAKSSERAIVSSLRRGTVPLPAALRALAGAGTSASVPVVLEFVADENPIARAEAIKAAALLLDPTQPDGRAVEPLAAALREGRLSPAERVAVVELLGRAGAARAASVLTPLAANKDTALRIAAIDALGAIGPLATREHLTGGSKSVEETLLDALDDKARDVRLHAAMALSRVGGERTRETLLTKLEGSEESDRFAVFHALGGILERSPSERVVERLGKALGLAAGPERDAIVEALSRTPLTTAVELIIRQTKPTQPTEDRRSGIAALAKRASTSKPAFDALLGALSDSDASVRAEAAWSLGTAGNPQAIDPLLKLLSSVDGDVATNATASIARLLAWSQSARPDRIASSLCPRLTDVRSHVRTNALAGLNEASTRCADSAQARAVLAEDASDDARAEAASVVARSNAPDDRAALDKCAGNDRSGAVATRCKEALQKAVVPEPRSVTVQPVTVFIAVDAGQTTRPLVAYTLRYAHGYLRAGIADRRGAVIDPAARGPFLELRRPTGAR